MPIAHAADLKNRYHQYGAHDGRSHPGQPCVAPHRYDDDTTDRPSSEAVLVQRFDASAQSKDPQQQAIENTRV